MAQELHGRRIAFVVANEGIEQAELTSPWQAVEEAGGQPVLVATKSGQAQAFNHLDKADTFDVDLTTSEAVVDDFDGLMLPGGVANADQLRGDPAAVGLVREFFDTGRPVAVICHGPWAIVEADRVRGRTLTAWPTLQTDIRNAGGTWVDAEVKVCEGGPNTLVSSRKPDDLPAFNPAMLEAFAKWKTMPDADKQDRRFGQAARQKEERLDQALAADEPLPEDEPAGARPPVGSKARPK
jgi:protease I